MPRPFVLVGEHGPEIVNLPPGTLIIPRNKPKDARGDTKENPHV